MNDRSNNSPTERGVLDGPTGLGTSAARIPVSLIASGPQRIMSYTHVPYQVVGPVPHPDFYMPFSTRLSPHLQGARRHMMEWGRRMGMLDSLPGVPGSGIWDEHKEP